MGNTTKKPILQDVKSFPQLDASLLSEAFIDTIKSMTTESFPFVAEECFVEDITTKFRIIRTLGRGASCEVFEAQAIDDKTHDLVALKKLHLSDHQNQIRFKNEVEILASIQHSNVVKFYQAYVDANNLYIATKLCTGGDLLDRIRKFRVFSEAKTSVILKSLIETIGYCHDKNIVHRDLKPGNLVFEDDQHNANLIIIDFGDALQVNESETYYSPFGTLLYLPPEINRHRYGWEMKKSDMWSIGIIAFILVTGKAPFMGSDRVVMNEILHHRSIRWPPGCQVSKMCKEFISKLLTRDTQTRLSASEALREPFLLHQQSPRHLGDHLLQDIANFYDANMLKKILIEALVRDMTDKQRDMLVGVFNEMDKDKDGWVSIADVEKLLVETGLHEDDAKSRAKDIIERMGGAKNGKIDLNAFLRAKMTATLNQHKTEHVRNFLENHCSKQKIKVEGLKKQLEGVTDEPETLRQVLKIVSSLQQDENGCIQSQDFVAALSLQDTQIRALMSPRGHSSATTMTMTTTTTTTTKANTQTQTEVEVEVQSKATKTQAKTRAKANENENGKENENENENENAKPKQKPKTKTKIKTKTKANTNASAKTKVESMPTSNDEQQQETEAEELYEDEDRDKNEDEAETDNVHANAHVRVNEDDDEDDDEKNERDTYDHDHKDAETTTGLIRQLLASIPSYPKYYGPLPTQQSSLHFVTSPGRPSPIPIPTSLKVSNVPSKPIPTATATATATAMIRSQNQANKRTQVAKTNATTLAGTSKIKIAASTSESSDDWEAGAATGTDTEINTDTDTIKTEVITKILQQLDAAEHNKVEPMQKQGTEMELEGLHILSDYDEEEANTTMFSPGITSDAEQISFKEYARSQQQRQT